MRTSDFRGGSYLSTENLMGRAHRVTISDITTREFEKESRDGEKYMKLQPILHFDGKDKSLVVNATRLAALENILGEDMDAWIGREITLQPGSTMFGTRRVGCIDILPAPTQGAVSRPQPPPVNQASPEPSYVAEGPPVGYVDQLPSDDIPF